jgi:hypothetical protein
MGRQRGAGRRWLALVASAALHALLFLVVIEGRLPEVPERRAPTLITLPPEDEPDRAVPIPAYVPRVDGGGGRRQLPTPVARPQRVDPATPVTLEPREPVVRDSVPPPRRPTGRIGPALGTGRLWVRPLPLPPRDLAKRLEPSHAELVDSAVTAIVQRYLDSIAAEPGADRVKLPDWTTEVEGLKFGLDSRSIYIAGLRIPAAVLALLPLPAGGDQRSALDKNGQWIAEDLRRAAARATTLDDFKEAVRNLREERQRQKDLERAQRELPDSASRE